MAREAISIARRERERERKKKRRTSKCEEAAVRPGRQRSVQLGASLGGGEGGGSLCSVIPLYRERKGHGKSNSYSGRETATREEQQLLGKSKSLPLVVRQGYGLGKGPQSGRALNQAQRGGREKKGGLGRDAQLRDTCAREREREIGKYVWAQKKKKS